MDPFFLSDQSLKNREIREKKMKVHEKTGNPFSFNGKVLCLQIKDDMAYIGTAGFTAVIVNLLDRTIVAQLKGHKGPVTSITVLEDKNIITTSWDKTSILWDNDTKSPIKLFEGHADFVKCSCVYGKFLFTGSSDKHIRKWDLSTGECLQVLEGHTRGIDDMLIYNDVLISASNDGSIKVWKIETGELLGTLKGHATSVYALCLREDTLYSASADKTVKVWNLEKGWKNQKEEFTLDHPDWVTSMIIKNKFLITGAKDENIRVWDLDNLKISSVIIGHYDAISCLADYKKSLFYSGSLDSTVRQWDLNAPIQEVVVEEKQEKQEKSLLTAEEEEELNELLNSED